jgi:nitrate reductase delta subunit
MEHAMHHYQVLSRLLLYPEPELIAHLPELDAALAAVPEQQALLRPLLAHLETSSLIDLQQQYVATFDRNPSHSLHLFEHIHGESRDRGQAMVDLMEEYKRHGLQMVGDDLPDFVPLFLEFLAQLDETASAPLLGDAVHVLAHIGRKLTANGSPYAPVFTVLERLSPVAAEMLAEPPVRDMDEALETFGPGADGVEPLLRQGPGQGLGQVAGGVHPVHFHPQPRRAA